MVVYNVNECHCPQLRWLKVEDTGCVVDNIFSQPFKKNIFLSQICGKTVHKSVANGLLTTLMADLKMGTYVVSVAFVTFWHEKGCGKLKSHISS